MGRVNVNEVAPDFELEDFTGKKFRLSHYKGSRNILIVLNRGFI